MDLIDFCNTDINYFKENYRKHFYYDNLIDYALFIMGNNIIDNLMKNTHLSCSDINVNKTFLITPWDLDCSLGGLYEGSHYEENTKLTNNSEIIVNALKQPTVTDVKIKNGLVDLKIEKELGVEVIDNTTIKVAIEDDADEYEEIYDSENEDELNINVDDLDDDYLDESTNNG